jgi:hypothetical protein
VCLTIQCVIETIDRLHYHGLGVMQASGTVDSAVGAAGDFFLIASQTMAAIRANE